MLASRALPPQETRFLTRPRRSLTFAAAGKCDAKAEVANQSRLSQQICNLRLLICGWRASSGSHLLPRYKFHLSGAAVLGPQRSNPGKLRVRNDRRSESSWTVDHPACYFSSSRGFRTGPSAVSALPAPPQRALRCTLLKWERDCGGSHRNVSAARRSG